MALQEAFVTSADGTPIQYFSYGNGVPVILIHGLQGSAAAWLTIVDQLPKGFQYLIPNLRGRGKSGHPDSPTDYQLDRFVDDAQAILESAAASKPAVVVGWSMGASVAWEFARRPASRQVLGWVFVSGTPDPHNSRRLFDPQSDLKQAMLDRVKHLPADSVCSPEVGINAWLGFRDVDFLNQPPVLHAPSLMIHGNADQDCPIESAQMLAKHLGSQWIVFEGVGHSLLREQPKRFVDELSVFLHKLTFKR